MEPFPFDDVQRIVEEELGARISKASSLQAGAHIFMLAARAGPWLGCDTVAADRVSRRRH